MGAIVVVILVLKKLIPRQAQICEQSVISYDLEELLELSWLDAGPTYIELSESVVFLYEIAELFERLSGVLDVD